MLTESTGVKLTMVARAGERISQCSQGSAELFPCVLKNNTVRENSLCSRCLWRAVSLSPQGDSKQTRFGRKAYGFDCSEQYNLLSHTSTFSTGKHWHSPENIRHLMVPLRYCFKSALIYSEIYVGALKAVIDQSQPNLLSRTSYIWFYTVIRLSPIAPRRNIITQIKHLKVPLLAFGTLAQLMNQGYCS